VCPTNKGSNIRVNQNCLNISAPNLQGRSQAQNETAIAVNPSDSSQVVAGYNDYRRGDGTCGMDFGNGASWTDATAPNNFVRGGTFGGVAREYFQASGDPSVAWDTKGNAYYDCQMFLRGTAVTNNPDVSSGIYVFRSTGDAGASWNFPGHPAVEEFTTNPAELLDKPYMSIDDSHRSPFTDRIYVTYTNFAADGSGKIFEVHSSDFGQTFSAPVLVSGTSTLCPNGFTAPNSCDEDQFSQPFTAPDGTLYVVFANYNTHNGGDANHYQVLIAKSTDGGATFGPVVKVADFNDLPECSDYQGGQDAFRACVKEKGPSMDSVFRAANYPVGGVNPTNPSQVVVTFASYINIDSKATNGCTQAGFNRVTANARYNGVKTAGACNNKIVYSVSNDGGTTFTGGTAAVEHLPVVNQDPGQTRTDQWFQWAQFADNGRLVVSYYDRQYGNDEFAGASDVSLSDSSDLVSFTSTRVTTSSMPAPTQFPDAQGNSLFWGDYAGLTVSGSTAFPIWADSRDADLFLCDKTGTAGKPPALCTGTEPDGDQANDENVYSEGVPLP
jgi:hypothetical protein